MCGLTGYFLLNSKPEMNNVIIKEMLTLQKHRGPDDSGIIGISTPNGNYQELSYDNYEDFSICPDLVFGFNRLSILDISSNGHQPMISRHKNIILMMNGEVYNAFDYKNELENKGYHFKSTSDTEVVLYLYEEYGLKGMLDRLNGMFALVIYDIKLKKLYLIRDRFGIKPLYLLKESDRISFSSEMKSFKALPGFHFQLSHDNIPEFLLFRNLINETLFKDIVNIDPGHYMEISANGQTDQYCYYDIRKDGRQFINDSKAELILKEKLQNAVKRQMLSDVKLGCQLSGGVDSSIVTAYANKYVPYGSLETISIVFEDPCYSEKKYVDQVSDKLNLLSHQFILNAEDYFNTLEEAIWHFEQPLNHPNTIGIKLLSKEAKRHVTVLLSGEGADEAFGGYDRFLNKDIFFKSRTFLSSLKKNVAKAGIFLSYWFKPDYRYLMETSFIGISQAHTIYSDFSFHKAIRERLKIWQSISGNSGQKKRKFELLAYLPDLLMRQDKMSMAHSIENRVPFLENEVITTALSLKDNLLVGKINGQHEGKILLKKLCGHEFGTAFAYRKKNGFSIPLRDFYNSESFRKIWEEKLLPGIEKRKLFNTKPLQKWMKTSGKLSPQKLDAIWLMINFEIWAQQYLD